MQTCSIQLGAPVCVCACECMCGCVASSLSPFPSRQCSVCCDRVQAICRCSNLSWHSSPHTDEQPTRKGRILLVKSIKPKPLTCSVNLFFNLERMSFHKFCLYLTGTAFNAENIYFYTIMVNPLRTFALKYGSLIIYA